MHIIKLQLGPIHLYVQFVAKGPKKVREVHIGENVADSLSLEVLRLVDDFIITNCIMKCNSAEFTYGNKFLDGVMLDKGGISKCDATDGQLNICPECYTTLKCNKMP